MKEVLKNHYKVDKGNKIFLSRAFIKEVNNKDHMWFCNELLKLSENEKYKGYERLKTHIAKLLTEIRAEKEIPNYAKLDYSILKKAIMPEFSALAKHFFGVDKSDISNDDIWVQERSDALNYWMKYHFLMGAFEDEIINNGYEPVYEIFRKQSQYLN